MDSHGDDGHEIWLSLYSPNWESKLDELFDGFASRKDNRLIHRLNNKTFQNHIKWQEKVPNGYTMKKFDSSSYEFIKKRNWQGFWHLESKRFGWFAFINDCLSKNLIPVWCCWQSTQGSKELAEKLGFEVIENRRAIFIKP